MHGISEVLEASFPCRLCCAVSKVEATRVYLGKTDLVWIPFLGGKMSRCVKVRFLVKMCFAFVASLGCFSLRVRVFSHVSTEGEESHINSEFEMNTDWHDFVRSSLVWKPMDVTQLLLDICIFTVTGFFFNKGKN